MSIDNALEDAYVERLTNDRTFNFKKRRGGKYLEGGVCPNCGRKEVFVSFDKPWRLQCNRLNECGWSESTSNIYPDIVDEIVNSSRSSNDPKAVANAYMKYERGFDLDVIKGWYCQETFFDKESNTACETVRFWLDRDRDCFWERLIGKAKKNGQRQNIRGKRRRLPLSHPDYDEFDGSVVKGLWWTPPKQKISEGDTVVLVEGIFHAIALFLCGYKVAATLAAGYYPELSIRQYYGKGILWVWALDDDNAGHTQMSKHRTRMEHKGEKTTMAITGTGERDWDDLYKSGTLRRNDDSFFESCLYRGALAASTSIDRKAFVFFQKKRRANYVLDFKNRLYSISVRLEELDQTTISNVDIEEKYNHSHVPAEFSKHTKIIPISPCFPRFLYAMRNQLTRELSFFLRFDFANGAPRIQETLDKSALESAKSFHKALVGIAAGGAFYGTENDFRLIYEGWFKHKSSSEEVRVVDYVGYDDVFKGYVFRDFGFRNGRFIPVDDVGLIRNGDVKIRSTIKDISFALPDTKADANWVDDMFTAFGINGLVTLAYWFGTYFSVQVRTSLGWFPFLELSGAPGTGKTNIVKFLWKASARTDGYEGINPTKYTPSGRARVMMKLAGLPLVLIEGDTEEAKQAFDINEMKDAFNGGRIRGIGVKTQGSETVEPPFKCGFIVAQNREVDCEKAMISRFIHLHWTNSHFSKEGSELVDQFNQMPAETSSAFLYKSLANEPKIVEEILEVYRRDLPIFRQDPRIKMPRIQETHCLVYACFCALTHVFGQDAKKYQERVRIHLLERAGERQRRLVDDHPDVVNFWEVFEMLNVRKKRDPEYTYMPKEIEMETLNHSKDEQLIAVKLVEVCREAEANRYRLPLAKDLKKVLKGSTNYQFIATKPIKSKITQKTEHCWVFRRPSKTS